MTLSLQKQCSNSGMFIVIKHNHSSLCDKNTINQSSARWAVDPLAGKCFPQHQNTSAKPRHKFSSTILWAIGGSSNCYNNPLAICNFMGVHYKWIEIFLVYYMVFILFWRHKPCRKIPSFITFMREGGWLSRNMYAICVCQPRLQRLAVSIGVRICVSI